jgi:hypothetical protein
MSNKLEIQITQEGPRNAIVKLTGIIDTSDIVESPAISLVDCLNNDVNLTLAGFRVDLIEWSMSAGMEIQLAWNGTIPQQIFPLAGRGRINSTNYGGFIPDTTRPGYDGSINLYSNGYAAGTVQNFTIILELIKLYQ